MDQLCGQDDLPPDWEPINPAFQIGNESNPFEDYDDVSFDVIQNNYYPPTMGQHSFQRQAEDTTVYHQPPTLAPIQSGDATETLSSDGTRGSTIDEILKGRRVNARIRA